MGDAEPLADARDARQHFARDDDRLPDRLELVETIVAGAAVRSRVCLAEIPDEVLVTASDARGVSLDVAEQLSRRIGQLAAALEHQPPLHEVRGRVHQHAFRFEPVAARAPRFLLVMLERLRRAGVHDEPDVRAIDSHAERHGGDHDVGPLLEKRVLVAVPILVVHPGVVRQRAYALLAEPRGKRIDLAA